MGELVELRRHQRFIGNNVVAKIGNEIVEVKNISAAGMRVVRPAAWTPERNIHFDILPQIDGELAFNHAIPIHGHVVGSAPDHLRIAFSAVSYPLARVIEALNPDHTGAAAGWS